jgi:3-mercaptopyruvate sulfurtransferase SseA
MTRHIVVALAASLALFAAAGDSCGSKKENRGARAENTKGGSAEADAKAQATAGAADPFASIPRVSVRELERALREGRAVAVDVRPSEAYELEHIAGAVSIPEDEILDRAGELPKDKLAVAYCA